MSFIYVDQVDTAAPPYGATAESWTAERHVTALYEAHALSLARFSLPSNPIMAPLADQSVPVPGNLSAW
jgi:hypothetical protein